MKQLSLFSIACLFICSCNYQQRLPEKQDIAKTGNSTKTDTHPQKLSQQTDIVKLDTIPDTTKELFGYRYYHYFSDTSKKDDFSLIIYGKNVLKGIVVFKIVDYKKRQIFREVYPASEFLVFDDDSLTSTQKVNELHLMMAHFFNKSDFSSPAIGRNDKYEYSFITSGKSDIANWKDIQSDQTAIKFQYFCGYESNIGIAYSKKQKKVVLIYYSD